MTLVCRRIFGSWIARFVEGENQVLDSDFIACFVSWSNEYCSSEYCRCFILSKKSL